MTTTEKIEEIKKLMDDSSVPMPPNEVRFLYVDGYVFSSTGFVGRDDGTSISEEEIDSAKRMLQDFMASF